MPCGSEFAARLGRVQSSIGRPPLAAPERGPDIWNAVVALFAHIASQQVDSLAFSKQIDTAITSDIEPQVAFARYAGYSAGVMIKSFGVGKYAR